MLGGTLHVEEFRNATQKNHDLGKDRKLVDVTQKFQFDFFIIQSQHCNSSIVATKVIDVPHQQS